MNAGQFGAEATLSATLTPPVISPADVALSACPIGALFQSGVGCVWDDNGRRVDDYEQYRCEKLGLYWSFATKACVASTANPNPEDGRPPCQAGFIWDWSSKTCHLPTVGGPAPFPTPPPEATSSSDLEREERAKACPVGSTYEPPQGCVWSDTGKPVYDSSQYRCDVGTNYSFSKTGCVPNPAPGSSFPDDARPTCTEEGTTFRWELGKCAPEPKPYVPTAVSDLAVPQPTFVTPDNPFYFLKRGFLAVQSATAFTAEAREQTRLAHARERLAEAYDQLEQKDEAGFKSVLAEYTANMQTVFNNLSGNVNLSDAAKKKLGDALASQAVEQNLLLQKATVIASDEMTTPISAAVSVTIQGMDRAADLQGDPPIPPDVLAKIEALPDAMVEEKDKQAILAIDNRLEARLRLSELVEQGFLTQADTAVFDAELAGADPGALIKVNALQTLDQIANLETSTQEITDQVEKTEDVAEKLDEFRSNFEVGETISAEIRPYVRLTQIDEIANTIRPDIIRLEDYGNRKDVQLAIATLQEEFKPTRESMQKVEDFRRNNPGRSLPFDLARIEALSFGVGVRNSAGPCFLPSPPFPSNTPCPPPGSAIPITGYYSGGGAYPIGGFGPGSFGPGVPPPATGPQGEQLVYGKGPSSERTGQCPNGYHWMYDSGGWCMSNSGSYGTGGPGGPSGGGGPGYTPYSPYYSTPGYPPTSYGYQGAGPYYSTGAYTPPNYYGPAPTTYTTNPYPGSVPGSGPTPTAPGQCPDGYHWMGDSGGWGMANGGTDTPGSGGGGGGVPPSGGG